jgi:hypothetical protein
MGYDDKLQQLSLAIETSYQEYDRHHCAGYRSKKLGDFLSE